MARDDVRHGRATTVAVRDGPHGPCAIADGPGAASFVRTGRLRRRSAAPVAVDPPRPRAHRPSSWRSPSGRRRPRRSAATRRSRKMIVWPVDQQQPDHGEQQHGAHGLGPAPDDAERRQHDEHDQHDELEPEAAETRAALGLEVRRRLYWTGPVDAGGRGGVGSAFGSIARIGDGHEPERYGTRPQRRGRCLRGVEPRRRVGRQSLDDLHAGDRAQDRRIAQHLPPARPAAEHDPLPVHHPRVDPDRQPGRQPEHRDAPDLHPGDVAGRLGRRERGLARAEPVADRAIDVEAVRRQHDARGVPGRIALADDEDRVRRVLRREPVRGTERRGIGQVGVAGEQLVLDPERVERRLESCRPRRGRVVARSSVGHGAQA